MSGTTEITLGQRLNLLEQGNAIDADVRAVVDRLIRRASISIGQSLDTATGHMFVTHLAMALQRAKAGEALSEMLPGLAEELADRQTEIALAREILDEAEDALKFDLPQTEVYLVAAYLAALGQEEA